MMTSVYMILWTRQGEKTEGKLAVISNFVDGWEQRYFPQADPANVTAYNISSVAKDTAEEPCLFYSDNGHTRDGAAFILFAEPGHNASAIAKAKSYLRNNFDVTGIRVIHVDLLHEPGFTLSKELPS